MKKLITLFFVFAAFSVIQAQNIPLVNGDCSTDAALTGVSPYIITGFTVSDATAKLTVANCSISNGSLRIVGPANGKQGDVTVITDKVDVSSYPTDQTFSFACTIKSTLGVPTGDVNVNITAWDVNGTAIAAATAFVGGAITKLTNTLTTGVAANIGANVKLVPTAGVAKLSFVLQVGKYLTNDLIIDDFTLIRGVVPVVTVTPPTNLAFSTEAGIASAESSFIIVGTGLTSEVKVYGGVSLEYSTTSGVGFSQDTLKFAPASDGSLASTTVYARIRAGVVSVPTASSTVITPAQIKSTIFNKVAGLKTVQFTATITGFATTLPTVDTLSTSPALAYHKSLKITANSLSADLLVSAGSKLEIATDSLFTSAQSSLILPSVGDTVYVRLKKGLPIGIITDETTKVSITSTGFISKYVQFVGNSVLELAVRNVNNSNIKCFVTNGYLNITGLDAGKQISIFNNQGQKVKSATATDNTSITLPNKGIYFVKSDGFVQKVLFK
jgi:hypothetical protein